MKKTISILVAAWAVATAQATVIYSAGFNGAAGTPAKELAPETAIPSFFQTSESMALDGNGHLEANKIKHNANYRFRLDTAPLNNNPSIRAVTCSVALRAPLTEWVAVAFHGENRNGVLTGKADSGPWLQINPSSVVVRGGHSTKGSQDVFSGTHEPGQRVAVELTYHFDEKTVDLSVNGSAVASALPVTHLLEGTEEDSDPRIQWVQLHLRAQPSAAEGGAYIDSLAVETLPMPPNTTRQVTALRAAAVAVDGHRVIIKKESPAVLPQRDADTLWVDAADFQNYGGWLLDTQFIHLMGAPYLIAAGEGTPVENASAQFEVRESGRYRLWVRSRNWAKDFAPGKFQVRLNGKVLPSVFGAADSDQWVWEDAGTVDLKAGTQTVGLGDLTGFYGRCAAMVLSKDTQYVPPKGLDAFRKERARLTGVSLEPVDHGMFDVIVVGGGSAGCPAALAAARNGARTAVIQNRPVLGGNASVELGVGVRGAAMRQSYAREGGIREELSREKVLHRDPRMTRAFARAAEAETNLTVYLNQHVNEAIMDGNRIVGVKAVDTLTGAVSIFHADMFIDTSGDGWLGYYAGADYRVGREARDEYNESEAPETADNITMSGCLMGNLKLGYGVELEDEPVSYRRPEWAYDLPPNPEFGRKIRGGRLGGQWWLEHPNDMDDIWNAEEARDELFKVVYGYWDFIKNKWEHKEKATDARMAYVPITEAKRESRRLMGDHVLSQNDVVSAREFPDTIGHAGWSMDIHNPKGILSGKDGPYDFDLLVPQNNIPFRTLYSRNIDNLLFAGRCMSVSHVALGTVRVEGTCSVAGQAAGTAAALCIQKGIEPRGIYENHIQELQQTLLKQDQYVPGISNQDADDLARHALASASSHATQDLMDQSFCEADPTRSSPLNRWFFFEAGEAGRIETLHVYLDSSKEWDVELPLTIWAVEDNRFAGDLKTLPRLGGAVATVPAMHDGYIAYEVHCDVPTPYFAVQFDAEKGLGISTPWDQRGHLGSRNGWNSSFSQVANQGSPRLVAYTEPPLVYTRDYSPENVIDGVSRIEGEKTHMWKSDPAQPLPQWVGLAWDRPQTIRSLQLTFDTNLDTWLYKVVFEQEVARDYEVQYRSDGVWKTLLRETDNCHRHRIHHFDAITTDGLRVVIHKTGGDPSARVYEIRAYP
ncbi:MAG: FAD-dependent oxidoreductase [Verrucomicrobiota bacterium]|nr:FAD-dependent oxidoreductase [Verrucomicrobiota bacterium]